MENINYILDTPKGEGAGVRSAADETAGEGDMQDVSEWWLSVCVVRCGDSACCVCIVMTVRVV